MLHREQVARLKQNGAFRTSHANDEQSTKESMWVPATTFTRKYLSRVTKEPMELLLCQGALYQITFNHVGNFSQSQLAVLMDLPDEKTVTEKKKLKFGLLHLD